jgi:hypothetical protein
VVLDRAGADEQLGADLRIREPVAGQRAIIASWAVSSPPVSTVRLWAVSPVAGSSRLARSANGHRLGWERFPTLRFGFSSTSGLEQASRPGGVSWAIMAPWTC